MSGELQQLINSICVVDAVVDALVTRGVSVDAKPHDDPELRETIVVGTMKTPAGRTISYQLMVWNAKEIKP